jgi:PHP family Zn ribbon phosphoesterase
LAREANVLDCELSYKGILDALVSHDPAQFLYTIEFFPEEGKYHFDGHRLCNVRLSPAETRQVKNRCPVCGKRLTVGVLHRVDALADREAGYRPAGAVPAKHLLPLEEIIAAALGQQPNTRKVNTEYDRLIARYGSELGILLDLGEEALAEDTPARTLAGILKVRQGEVRITPGYDGVYGKIALFNDGG